MIWIPVIKLVYDRMNEHVLFVDRENRVCRDSNPVIYNSTWSELVMPHSHEKRA